MKSIVSALSFIGRYDDGFAEIISSIESAKNVNFKNTFKNVKEEYLHLYPTNFDKRLTEYISEFNDLKNTKLGKLVNGKTVAIVGPKEPNELNGLKINKHDLIVRFNYLDNKFLNQNKLLIGDRTDISFYGIAFERNMRKQIIESLKKSPLKLAILRSPIDNEIYENYSQETNIDLLNYEFVTMYKAKPFGVPRVIYALLKAGASKISLFNMDFYTRADAIYHSGYSKFEEDQLLNLAKHDPLSNFKYLKRLMYQKMVIGDKEVQEILSWNDEKYVQCLNKQYEKIV